MWIREVTYTEEEYFLERLSQMKLFRTTLKKNKKEKERLWTEKEVIYVLEPSSFSCPTTHIHFFTIKVTKEKAGVCYYCSKVFMYKKENAD